MSPAPLQLENIGNFIKAITKYGVKPHDIFEANDLFENTNHTQVQSTLLALASMVSVGTAWAQDGAGLGRAASGATCATEPRALPSLLGDNAAC